MTETSPSPASQSPLLTVRGLKVHFPVWKGMIFRRKVGAVKAVDGIDLEINSGETLGIVGESGCGKSTTGRALIQLIRPTEGSVRYKDQELTQLTESQLRPLRRDLQMVFQDPYASLNPRMTVGSIISEPIKVHGILTGRQEIQDRVEWLMEVVGLSTRYIRRYPHEFSGGQRQRIGIARALALEPRFIVADEPVSSLDVSVQAQVLNLLMELQERFKLTYLFVAHNLAVVRHISDRVAVMYLGKIVEIAPRDLVFDQPGHPYTIALLSAVPEPNPTKGTNQRRVVLQGDVPSPLNPPSGCAFHPRCPFATDECRSLVPYLRELEKGHMVSCHHAEEVQHGGLSGVLERVSDRC